MISMRFRPFSFSEWTKVNADGENELLAIEILGARCLRAEMDAEIWSGDSWTDIATWDGEGVDAAIDQMLEDDDA